MAKDRRFPKALRLRRRQEFLKVQNNGTKVSSEPMLALALKNDLPYARLGLTVSKKVGDAPVRNRIRRRLRELFRLRVETLPGGVDVVLIARPGAATVEYSALSRAFDGLADRLRERFR